MEDTLTMIICIALFGAFLYFGYRDDYKRNPQEFVRTLVGLPLSFLLGILGIHGLDQKIKDWANRPQERQDKHRS